MKKNSIIATVITLLGAIAAIVGFILRNQEGYIESTYIDTMFFLGMIIVMVGIVMLIVAIKGNALQQSGNLQAKKVDVNKLAQAALLTALCYIGFQFFRFDIPVGVDKTAFHFGNVFCVLAALLLGGMWGGLAGAVGMTFADFTSSYVSSSPKTFLLKLCIGLIVGFIAHNIAHISESNNKAYVLRWSLIASIAGMAFNIVADPIVGYFYKNYILGIPQDAAVALAKIGAITTTVNAVIAVLFATMLYNALRPALNSAGLLQKVEKRR